MLRHAAAAAARVLHARRADRAGDERGCADAAAQRGLRGKRRPPALLGSVASAYDVRRRPPRPSSPTLLQTYEDALVDREVCRHARLPLYAHAQSTFSMMLGQLRQKQTVGGATVWYNRWTHDDSPRGESG